MTVYTILLRSCDSTVRAILLARCGTVYTILLSPSTNITIFSILSSCCSRAAWSCIAEMQWLHLFIAISLS